jgi:hypothetical protein
MPSTTTLTSRIERTFWLAESREDALRRARNVIDREHLYEEFFTVYGPTVLVALLDRWRVSTGRLAEVIPREASDAPRLA